MCTRVSKKVIHTLRANIFKLRLSIKRTSNKYFTVPPKMFLTIEPQKTGFCKCPKQILKMIVRFGKSVIQLFFKKLLNLLQKITS